MDLRVRQKRIRATFIEHLKREDYPKNVYSIYGRYTLCKGKKNIRKKTFVSNLQTKCIKHCSKNQTVIQGANS